MPTEIHTPLAGPRGACGLPQAGRLGGELQLHDEHGNVLVEFVLPSRFPGGPSVPFKASWWTVQPGMTSPAEAHAVQEQWFVGQGQGTVFLDARQFDVRGGDAVYIPSGATHCVRSTGAEELLVFSVWWP